MDIATHVVKFNAQTAGRDKAYRLIQYTARFLKWYWTRQGVDKSLSAKCQIIENAFGMTRKAMRLGKSLDLIQGALANASLSDTVIRLCLVVGKLSQACYLLVDHAVWISKLGLVPGVDAAKLNRTAARFWLVSIVAGIVRDVIDIVRICRAELRKKRHTEDAASGVVAQRGANIFGLVARVVAHRPLVIDTARNVADVFLPSATLGYIATSEGFQGLMGMISSYMGILAIWDPALKLSP